MYVYLCSTKRNTYSNIVKMALMDILVSDEDTYYCQAKNRDTPFNEDLETVELRVSSKLYMCIAELK